MTTKSKAAALRRPPALSQDPDQLARDLITALAELGVRADRLGSHAGSTTITVWGADARLSAATVTVNGSGPFFDFAWGVASEHALPLATPISQVAAALLNALSEGGSPTP